MKTGLLKSFDKNEIWIYVWDKVENPKGIVQIVHGMAEHAGRYEAFAKFLNTNGYIVVADDHRGHGRTVPDIEDLGKSKGENLFYDTLQDEIFISKKLKEQYDLPLFVFGHSYGSFITQGYIELCKYATGVILCGSACMKKRFDVFAGKIVASITSKIKGPDAPAKLIAKMSFGNYDKMVKTGSWLNTDEQEVKKYYADPFCGKTLCAKFYKDFFKCLSRIYVKKNLKNITKNLPILIISGENDPVGGMGKSVKKLFKIYNHMEMDAKLKLFKKARHEILNEPIKDEVYSTVLNFMNNHNK